MLLSDCCGAEPSDPVMLDIGICPDCHENCEFVDDEEDNLGEDISSMKLTNTSNTSL